MYSPAVTVQPIYLTLVFARTSTIKEHVSRTTSGLILKSSQSHSRIIKTTFFLRYSGVNC